MNFRFFKLVFILAITLFTTIRVNAQDVPALLQRAKVLIDEEKYVDGIKLLDSIEEEKIDQYGGKYILYYNYKGSCLYNLKKYEEAILCIEKGIKVMENLSLKDCCYLEFLFGIGICYNELKEYPKAEKYLRKSIIEGAFIGQNCVVREQTYDELADLYVKTGKQKLAGFCSKRKTQETIWEYGKDEEKTLDLLYELAESYANQGNEEEYIKTYKGLLNLIQTKQGIVNDDYLKYAELFSNKLVRSFNKPLEASVINKKIIEIGKEFKTYKEIVSHAYVDYLYYLASQGKKDSVELMLPEAEKYCKNTTYSITKEFNLYEGIGLGFYEANEKEEAVKYLKKEWKGKAANSIMSLCRLGDYYYYSDPEKAISYFKKAEEQLSDRSDGEKAYIYESLMYVHGHTGRFEESLNYAEKADEFIRKIQDNEYYTSFIADWASFAVNNIELEKARDLITRIEPYLDNLSDGRKIVVYSNCGFVYLKIGEYDKAIDIINKGIGITTKTQGDKCPILSTFYHNLGRSYMLKHNYKQALSALYKSKELQLEQDGKVLQRTLDYIKDCEEK